MRTLVFTIALVVCLSSTGCGNKDTDSAKTAYETATNMIRERMKIPKSTRFPEFEGELKSDDTAHSMGPTFEGDSVKVELGTNVAHVYGYYESQNKMGVFIPGKFAVHLRRDEKDAWVPLLGTDADVKIESN